MAGPEIFKLAAERALPAAITAELESGGYSRYQIGHVVYFSAKPTIVAWRRQTLQFAQSEDGDPVRLGQILTPDCAGLMDKLRTQSTLFARGGRREMKLEFTKPSLPGGGGDRETMVKADFGTVYQASSNLFGLLDSSQRKLKVDLNHPVVQKILENEGDFFVVSTVYEAQRAEIAVSEKAGGGEEPQWKEVCSSTQTTALAMLLLRLHISSSGLVQPILHGGYTPRSLSVEAVDSEEGEHGGDMEEIDAAHAHYQCGSRELQLFLSDTYAGVINEAAEFVKALRSNKALQNEFISLLKTSGRDLAKLSTELRAVQETLVRQSEPGGLESFPGINSKLSTAPPLRLEEVKALTVATEAFRELSLLAVNRILSLTAEEKATVFDLFRTVPISSSVHTFSRAPFSDSDTLYFQLLKRIGFGQSAGHLQYQTDESGVDMIAVAITAIQAATAEN